MDPDFHFLESLPTICSYSVLGTTFLQKNLLPRKLTEKTFFHFFPNVYNLTVVNCEHVLDRREVWLQFGTISAVEWKLKWLKLIHSHAICHISASPALLLWSCIGSFLVVECDRFHFEDNLFATKYRAEWNWTDCSRNRKEVDQKVSAGDWEQLLI